MKEFFRNYPPEFSELTALKMIKHKLHEAYHKCKDNDETYVEDLEKVHEMIEMYLKELN